MLLYIIYSIIYCFMPYVCIFVGVESLICVSFVTPSTIAHQAPPSMEFSKQEYWSGLPFPSPGDLPDPGIEPGSPVLQADALPSEPPEKPLLYQSVQFSSVAQSCPTLRPPELQHARPPCPSPAPRVHPNPFPLCQ